MEIPLYKIKDFANLIGLTVDTLLFYEKKGLFIPFKIDENTGYRYYSSSQLPTISNIIQLKSLDFTLNEIKQFISGEFTIEEKKEKIKEKIIKLQQIISLFSINDDKQNFSAYVKVIPSHYVISIHRKLKDYMDILYEYENLMYEMVKNKLRLMQPQTYYCRYNDAEFKLKDIDVDIFAGVEKSNLSIVNFIPEQKYVCTLWYGDYQNIVNAYMFLNKYSENQKYEIIGSPVEQYLESYGSKNSKDDFITEVRFPIK